MKRNNKFKQNVRENRDHFRMQPQRGMSVPSMSLTGETPVPRYTTTDKIVCATITDETPVPRCGDFYMPEKAVSAGVAKSILFFQYSKHVLCPRTQKHAISAMQFLFSTP